MGLKSHGQIYLFENVLLQSISSNWLVKHKTSILSTCNWLVRDMVTSMLDVFFFFAPNSKTNSCSPDMFFPFIGAWAAGISPTSARNLVNFPNFCSMLNQWWSNCRLVVAQMSHRLKREGASSNIAENSFINLWLSSNDTFITWEDSREVNLSALTHPWAVHFWIRNRAKSRNVRSTYLPYLLEPSWGLLVLGCFSTDRCDLRPIFPSTALSHSW